MARSGRLRLFKGDTAPRWGLAVIIGIIILTVVGLAIFHDSHDHHEHGDHDLAERERELALKLEKLERMEERLIKATTPPPPLKQTE